MDSKTEDNVDTLIKKISLYSDEKAFHTLFQGFFSPLCLYAHQYLDEMDTCEDVVQEVFYRLWKNRENLDIQSSSRAYLKTCVRNSCLDMIRKQSVERQWIEGTMKFQSEELDFDLYTTVELENLFYRALEKLPERISKAFCMHRLEGKTYAEIAQAMEISIKTVEAYISKALNYLREELKEFLTIIIIYLSLTIG